MVYAYMHSSTPICNRHVSCNHKCLVNFLEAFCSLSVLHTVCPLQKLKPEPEAEGREKLLESRAEKQDKVCPDPPPASTPSPPTSNTTVTNTSDLNDSREINFEYLKHVVLKFMSSRDAEVKHHGCLVLEHYSRLICVGSVGLNLLCVSPCQAYQLIRAVSVLLNFSRDEEEMLKQTLEYKVSPNTPCDQILSLETSC